MFNEICVLLQTDLDNKIHYDRPNYRFQIPELSKTQPQKVSFRLEHRHLYADFGDNIPQRMAFKIYSLDGRLLLSQSGKSDIDLSALKTGVYAVQLTTDSKATTGSTLIRLQ